MLLYAGLVIWIQFFMVIDFDNDFIFLIVLYADSVAST